MAGSRLDKFGTIFKRVQGLLRSGAWSEVDRPLWYDVYEKFPPKVAPLYERPVPKDRVRPILYPEDILRVQFHKIYGNMELEDLATEDPKSKTNCQKFVDKYMELMATESPPDDVFQTAIASLDFHGKPLQTKKERKNSQEMKGKTKISALSNINELYNDEEYYVENKLDIDITELLENTIEEDDKKHW
ncbi:hypothetical protein SNE40_003929 [Patella caerulea]|uniref:Small ribosomal subunit protein mS23 n=1 Tax=Patella caerulea TaxID=87958 RepID=A0AAN8Q975_PATCE